jgi:pyruvate carboxylase subunit B
MIATRMKTEDMLPISEKTDQVGYYSMEMWGGATFDVCLRFLNEDPCERLRQLKKRAKNTNLQMLLRGQNLVGYRHYPDDIVVKFVNNAAKHGIDVFRVFDALNDIRNMEVSIKAVKKAGCTVEGSISYTISPVHTIEKYVSFAKQLAALDCDIICIKDMAGLLTPPATIELTKALIKEVGLPVHVHSHSTGGVAHMTLYAACEAGASYLDTVISPFSQGSSHPPTESIVAALKNTPFETGLDLELLVEIAAYFQDIKEKYKDILDPIAERIDTNVLVHQIPGGMLSNLVSQLKEQNALDKYEEVLKEVPRVRAELGYPPLVTPTSQIVGTQAVFNVILGQRYKLISKEVKDYIKGLYGMPPGPIDEKVKKMAIGDEEVTLKRPADSLEPMYESALKACAAYGDEEDDILSYALFPQVALDFFKRRQSGAPAPQSTSAAQPRKVQVTDIGTDDFGVKVGEKKFRAKVEKSGNSMVITIGDNTYEFDVGKIPSPTLKGAPAAGPVKTEARTVAAPKHHKAVEKGAVVAPMPGKVVTVKVKEGDEVKHGDLLLTLEAMKMQNEIMAPGKGKIKKVLVEEGSVVSSDDVMIILE